MIMILENGDFHARSRILLALLSLKARRQTRGTCFHTMIRIGRTLPGLVSCDSYY